MASRAKLIFKWVLVAFAKRSKVRVEGRTLPLSVSVPVVAEILVG